MIALDLNLNGAEAWELDTANVIYVTEGMLGVAVVPHGMRSGEPSVLLRVDLPSGHTVIAETSWRLLSTAVQAIAAQHGWMAGMNR
jgi:hypothetical protein